MAVRTCLNCVYVDCDLCEWTSCHQRGEPLVPRCANHPQWPGELHDVSGVPCRNYRPKPPEPKGNVRRIPVAEGQFVLVDAADYEWLKQWTWHLTDGYAARWQGNKRIYMHREIVQPPPGMVVDHIDHNRGNNCRSNLRACTHQENMYNRAKRSRSCSHFKGVGYRKRDRKWYAEVVFRGETIWLSFFDTEVEAARAYDRAAVEFFGEFAYLNFPDEWPPERRREVYAAAQPLRDALIAKAARARAEKGMGKRTKARVKTPARKSRKCSTREARRATQGTKSEPRKTTDPERV